MEPERRVGGHATAFNQEVGSSVHAAMVKRGVKGIEVAKLLEIEPQSLSARLHGRTPFKAHELIVIADRLGIDPGEFFGGAHNPRYVNVTGVTTRGGQMELPLESFSWTPEVVNGDEVIDLRELACVS